MASPENVLAESDNIMASEAISARLAEVSRIAESLDSVLRDVQGGFDDADGDEEVAGVVGGGGEKKADGGSGNQSDDWSSSVKSTEDESFVTASDCTCTPGASRSSSYHTASECRASPWWGCGESATERSSLDADSSEDADPEALPSIKLLSGVVITASSANLSFDESEHSFLTPTSNSEQADSDGDHHHPHHLPPRLPRTMNQSTSPVISSGSSSALNSINRRENLTLALTPEELEQIENDIRNNNNVTLSSGPDSSTPIKLNSSPTASEDSGNVSTISAKLPQFDQGSPAGTGAMLVVKDGSAAGGEIRGLTYYYQNIITKHTVKSCL